MRVKTPYIALNRIHYESPDFSHIALTHGGGAPAGHTATIATDAASTHIAPGSSAQFDGAFIDASFPTALDVNEGGATRKSSAS
jgi:hypothetical protein